MNKIKKIIVALGVFTMMIGSGFAMDNNPPAEPVKKAVVETEVLEEAPQQIQMGYGYKDGSGNCVFIAFGTPPTGCSIMNNGDICTEFRDGAARNLYLFVRESPSHSWVCTFPLRKPL